MIPESATPYLHVSTDLDTIYDGRPAEKDTPEPEVEPTPVALVAKGDEFDAGEMCRRYTKEAVRTVVDVMRDRGEKGAIRLKAAAFLLDRGWGRPSTAEESGTKSIAHHHVHEISTRQLEKILNEHKKTQKARIKKVSSK